MFFPRLPHDFPTLIRYTIHAYRSRMNYVNHFTTAAPKFTEICLLSDVGTLCILLTYHKEKNMSHSKHVGLGVCITGNHANDDGEHRPGHGYITSR